MASLGWHSVVYLERRGRFLYSDAEKGRASHGRVDALRFLRTLTCEQQSAPRASVSFSQHIAAAFYLYMLRAPIRLLQLVVVQKSAKIFHFSICQIHHDVRYGMCRPNVSFVRV